MVDARPSRETSLAGSFRLTSPERPVDVPIALPGDVHSALLAAGVIPDPYVGTNETVVMWVNRTPWTVERAFTCDAEDAEGFLTLTLENVDCIATVLLNGREVARTQNQFRRYDIDVTGLVRAGGNTLRLDFAVARDVADARAAAHPFPIPFAKMYRTNGLEGVSLNFVRKAACHAGWDWGICLLPTGVYGRMALRRSRLARQESVTVAQDHADGAVTLTISTRIHAFAPGTVTLRHRIDGQDVGGEVAVPAGESELAHTVRIAQPRLWWPNGHGDQPLYTLETDLDGEVTRRRIGLRQLAWIVEKDEIDHCFKVRVNGRDMVMFGANWIPADALPARITPEVVRDLLESARAANMTMIRVWGGGQYETDDFYDACDELGLLVWQDLMFSCMSYPSDRAFLAEVREEVTQQVRRLSHHACLALWCGDNEVIGSLNWYPETRSDPKRYLVNYDRLNSMLAAIVEDEDPARRFWPSSPSLGYLDFADGWHEDSRGDMHFWSVWHEAKPFDYYRTAHPRFASEFGFQSFPSPDVIASFTRPEDRNPSSPVMDAHQRDPGGKARIMETMARYFRFPAGFDNLVFLSQVQQGLAIKTAIEYWRSTKPRCMGMLYWQLNDIYPVASWSSLDHGGGWKVLHAMARRFFAPLAVVASPDGDTIRLRAMNEGAAERVIDLDIVAVRAGGGERRLDRLRLAVPTDRALDAATLPAGTLADDEFLWFTWSSEDGTPLGANDFMPRWPKHYDWQKAAIAARWTHDGDVHRLHLATDAPAPFVTATVACPGHFSDNAFTLLPGRDVVLTFHPRLGHRPTVENLEATLVVRHLRQTYE